MSYKIQIHCYKYNPQKEHCDGVGYWSDYPATFDSEEEANKEMQGMIRAEECLGEGYRPGEIRVRPATAPEEAEPINP
jgi:hypothetical protein